MSWTERQRAMLQDMGLRVWGPFEEPTPQAEAAVAAPAAPVGAAATVAAIAPEPPAVAVAAPAPPRQRPAAGRPAADRAAPPAEIRAAEPDLDERASRIATLDWDCLLYTSRCV